MNERRKMQYATPQGEVLVCNDGAVLRCQGGRERRLGTVEPLADGWRARVQGRVFRVPDLAGAVALMLRRPRRPVSRLALLALRRAAS